MTTMNSTPLSRPMQVPGDSDSDSDRDRERERDRDALLRTARRRVGRKLGFAIHAAVFVLVNAGLLAIDLLNGAPRGWHVPLWGWGIGLAIHGIVTAISLQGDGLRERLVEAEIERLRRRRG